MPLLMVQAFVNVLSVLDTGKKKEEGMIALVSTIPADMKMSVALESQLDRYENLRMPVLLMYGDKSAGFFIQGVKSLEKVLPQSQMHIFKGFHHSSPEEKTDELVAVLKQFFTVN